MAWSWKETLKLNELVYGTSHQKKANNPISSIVSFVGAWSAPNNAAAAVVVITATAAGASIKIQTFKSYRWKILHANSIRNTNGQERKKNNTEVNINQRRTKARKAFVHVCRVLAATCTTKYKWKWKKNLLFVSYLLHSTWNGSKSNNLKCKSELQGMQMERERDSFLLSLIQHPQVSHRVKDSFCHMNEMPYISSEQLPLCANLPESLCAHLTLSAICLIISKFFLNKEHRSKRNFEYVPFSVSWAKIQKKHTHTHNLNKE